MIDECSVDAESILATGIRFLESDCQLNSQHGCVSTVRALLFPEILGVWSDRQKAGMVPLIIQLQQLLGVGRRSILACLSANHSNGNDIVLARGDEGLV